MNEANKAVFLSYASQDAEAARHICDALRAAGVEVWFDQNELRGGDAWDAKIRKQIKECGLFVPVISANTQARLEGYFRLEWKLAEDRSHLMARGKPFIVPVAIDETSDHDAHVPDSFLAVQWTRLGSDARPDDFARQINRLLETPGGRPPTGRGADIQRRAISPKAANSRGTWVILAAMIGVLLLGGVMLWRLQQPATGARAAAAIAPPASADSAQITEARALIQQVRDLGKGRGTLANERDKLAAADKLLAKASELDPGNGELWGMWAVVDAELDRAIASGSKERQASARLKAKRAMSLAPESFDARFGEAASLVVAGGKVALAAAERELRGLQEEQPEHVPVNEWLQRALSLQGRREEAEHVRDELEKVKPGAALGARLWSVYFKRDYEEAEAIADQILTQTPSDRAAWMVKLWLTLRWHGDVDRALALFEQAPPEFATGDEGVVFGAELFRYRREAGRSLTLLRQHPGDWLESRYFAGPKAILMGKAYRIDQRHDAARNAFRSSIKMLDEKLSADPDNIQWLRAKAECLEWAGDDATAAWKLHDQVLGRGTTDRSVEGRMRGLEREAARPTAFLTPARLRLDPAHDELRSHPRFPALLAKLEADPRRNPKLPARAIPIASGTFAAPPMEKSHTADKSVAVLAFENRSHEKDSEYFSDGVSDELINVLGRVAGLKVIARTSSFAFKGNKSASASEIARALGVAHLVEGSVQQVGGRARVIARLIRADTGEQLWGESFDPELKDIITAQETTARAIAEALTLRLTLAGQTDSLHPEAVKLYLQGRDEWSLRTTEALRRAEDLFRRAVALEPKFARAHSGLVDTWVIRGQFDDSVGLFRNRGSAEMRRIVEKARLAVTLDPASAEAHASLGSALVEAWQPEEGRRELERALELNPNYATAHQWLGRTRLKNGDASGAIASLRRACEIDPLSSRMADNLGITLWVVGRGEDGLAEIERALRLQPDSEQATAQRAQVLAGLGRTEEAIAQAREVLRHGGIRVTLAVYALARSGREAEATRAFASLAPERALSRSAHVLAALGRWDECLASLHPDSMVPAVAEQMLFNPVFDPVRSDPRFVTMLETLGLSEAHERAQRWRAANPPRKAEAKK